MKNQIFIIIVAITFLTSGFFLFSRLSKATNTQFYSGKVEQTFTNIGNFIKESFEKEAKKENQALFTPISVPTTNSASPTTTPVKIKLPTPTPKNDKGTTLITNDKVVTSNKIYKNSNCYKFTITHLDGSSSALCYSQADYNELNSLQSQLRSAQSGYDYQVRVYNMYKDAQKEAFSPDFYNDSINKASQKAQEYKDKIGEISLQMYNIESRGY